MAGSRADRRRGRPAQPEQPSRRGWLTAAAIGVALTAASAVWVDRRVDAHEARIVEDQAVAMSTAVLEMGSPLLANSLVAVAMAAGDLDNFGTTLTPLLAGYPLNGSFTVIEVDDTGGFVRLAHAGPDERALDRLELPQLSDGGSGSRSTSVERLSSEEIIFATVLQVTGQPGRYVYGELALHTDWLNMLDQQGGGTVHFAFTFVSQDGTESSIYATDGVPTGRTHTEVTNLDDTRFVVQASATAATIGDAERFAPWFVAVVGSLLTALFILGIQAIRRRQQTVEFLSVETRRLDAALEEQRRVEQELAFRANHDPLTGLPNRAWLIDRLADTTSPRPTALFFLDLDGFKVVNDSLGHDVGDRLLQQIAERLANSVDDAVLTRFGGDEFVMVTFGALDEQAVSSIADRIRDAVRPAVATEEGDVFVTTSIGIRLIDDTVSPLEPEDLLRDADAAMYAAKELGRDRHVTFHPLVRAQAVERLRLDTGIRRALDEDELRIEYQPIVDMTDGSIWATEALIRWHDPVRGILMPDQFLPILADTNLLPSLDEYVITEAAGQLRSWLDAGHDIRLSVNLSAASMDRADFPFFLAQTAREMALPHGSLVVELSERRLSSVLSPRWVQAIADAGIMVAIDDFGSGFTSIASLRDHHIDAMKLDKAFIAPIGRDDRNDIIASSMISLATDLEVTVIAEGVENESQVTALRRLGCVFGQGTYFSAPIPPDRLTARLGRTLSI